MGSKNKLKRFKENELFPNVIQPELSDVQNKSEGKDIKDIEKVKTEGDNLTI